MKGGENMNYTWTAEENDSFMKANGQLIDSIINDLKSAGLTLREAEYLLDVVQNRISKEARV